MPLSSVTELLHTYRTTRHPSTAYPLGRWTSNSVISSGARPFFRKAERSERSSSTAAAAGRPKPSRSVSTNLASPNGEPASLHTAVHPRGSVVTCRVYRAGGPPANSNRLRVSARGGEGGQAIHGGERAAGSAARAPWSRVPLSTEAGDTLLGGLQRGSGRTTSAARRRRIRTCSSFSPTTSECARFIVSQSGVCWTLCPGMARTSPTFIRITALSSGVLRRWRVCSGAEYLDQSVDIPPL